jgi:hypothetical protein
MPEAIRDRLILCIPWVIGVVVSLVIAFTVPMRPNSLLAYLCMGLPGLLGGALSWVPPFYAVQIRKLRRTDPDLFRPRKRRSPKTGDNG